ncbi:MAG: hypothetical protein J7L04_10480 [Bacteroidales bacterium]|nr:hypothetical protein [Bacteroidales bacterium]
MKKEIWIIVPDLRGHGYSILTESKNSITGMAADVMELIGQPYIRQAVIE